MNYFIKPLSESELYSIHNQITFYVVFIWILVCFIGYFLNNKKYKIYITLLLISISFLQEVFDYINRFFINELYASIASIQTDLPLQLCHFAYWFSVLSLVSQIYKNKYGQFYFNCAYFLGFSGALQGILTVDLTGVYTFGDMIALHLQHSLIILNLLWVIFSWKVKFSKTGIFQAFLLTNFLIVVVGSINYVLNANYMFLCYPPNVDNLFILGKWPYYLFVLELVFFIYGYILYLPFKLQEIFFGEDYRFGIKSKKKYKV